MINNQQIIEFISAMDYKPSSNNSDYYIKRYMCGYEICVDFKKEQICYIDTKSSEQISLGDTTTSNFKNSENFVVLECVNRLLEKGYAPNSIVLENKWGLGHKEKGKLDILVKLGEMSLIKKKAVCTRMVVSYLHILIRIKMQNIFVYIHHILIMEV